MSLELSNGSSRSQILTLSHDSSDLQISSDSPNSYKHQSKIKTANIAYKKFISKIGLLFQYDTKDLDSLYTKIVECTNNSEKFMKSSDQDINEMIRIAHQLKQNHCILKNMVSVLDNRFLQKERDCSTGMNDETAFKKEKIEFIDDKKQREANEVSETSEVKNDRERENPFITEQQAQSEFFKTPLDQSSPFTSIKPEKPKNPFKQSHQKKKRRSLSKEKKIKFEQRLKKISDEMKNIRWEISEIESKNLSTSSNESFNLPKFLHSEAVSSSLMFDNIEKNYEGVSTKGNTFNRTQSSTKTLPRSQQKRRHPQMKPDEYEAIVETARQSIKSQKNNESLECDHIYHETLKIHNTQQIPQEPNHNKRNKSQQKLQAALIKLETRNTMISQYLTTLSQNIHQDKPSQQSQKTISNSAYVESSQLARNIAAKLQNNTQKASIEKQTSHIFSQQIESGPQIDKKQVRIGGVEILNQNQESEHGDQTSKFKMINNVYQNDEQSISDCQQDDGSCSLREHATVTKMPRQYILSDNNGTAQHIIIPKKNRSSIFKDAPNVESKISLSDDAMTGRISSGQEIKKIKETVSEMFKKIEEISNDHFESKSNKKMEIKESDAGDYNFSNPTQGMRKQFHMNEPYSGKPLNFSFQSNLSKESLESRPSHHKMLVTFNPSQERIADNNRKYQAYLSPKNQQQSPKVRRESKSLENRSFHVSPVQRFSINRRSGWQQPKKVVQNVQIRPPLPPRQQQPLYQQLPQFSPFPHNPSPKQLTQVKSQPIFNRISPSYTEFPKAQNSFYQTIQHQNRSKAYTRPNILPNYQYPHSNYQNPKLINQYPQSNSQYRIPPSPNQMGSVSPRFIESKISYFGPKHMHVNTTENPFNKKSQQLPPRDQSLHKSGSMSKDRSRSKHSKKGISIINRSSKKSDIEVSRSNSSYSFY